MRVAGVRADLLGEAFFAVDSLPGLAAGLIEGVVWVGAFGPRSPLAYGSAVAGLVNSGRRGLLRGADINPPTLEEAAPADAETG